MQSKRKRLSRWYPTPSKLRSTYPSHSDTCRRGHSAFGTTLHIWWDCAPIKNIWILFTLYHRVHQHNKNSLELNIGSTISNASGKLHTKILHFLLYVNWFTGNLNFFSTWMTGDTHWYNSGESGGIIAIPLKMFIRPGWQE